MKKTPQLITGLVLASTILLNTGCATMFSGNMTEVVLVNPPNDLKVYEDGKELKIEEITASTKQKGLAGYEGSSVTTYYTSGVLVSKKTKHHKLTLESQGKKGDVNLRTKVKGGVAFLDIITLIGVPIDAITKKWRVIKNNHVDVPAIISGTKPQRQKQLKKIIRKQAEAK